VPEPTSSTKNQQHILLSIRSTDAWIAHPCNLQDCFQLDGFVTNNTHHLSRAQAVSKDDDSGTIYHCFCFSAAYLCLLLSHDALLSPQPSRMDANNKLKTEYWYQYHFNNVFSPLNNRFGIPAQPRSTTQSLLPAASYTPFLNTK
jgi:hypothetical protein